MKQLPKSNGFEKTECEGAIFKVYKSSISANALQISEGKDLETKILTLKQNIIMKTKTSNYRRHFAFAYVLLVAVIFCGCQAQTQNEKMSKEKDLFNFGIQTVEHDSCEYVLIREPSQGDIEIIHKHNCKFCAERSKK